MTRTQRRAVKRIARIDNLCVRLKQAIQAHKRGLQRDLEKRLIPLVKEQLEYELKQGRELTADGWQDVEVTHA